MRGARGCVVGGPTVLNTGAPAKKQQKGTHKSRRKQKPGSRKVRKVLVHWPTAAYHRWQTQCGWEGWAGVQVSQKQASLVPKRRGVAVSGERQSGRVAEWQRALRQTGSGRLAGWLAGWQAR